MIRRHISTSVLLVTIFALVAVPALAAGQGKEGAPGQAKDKGPKTPITITGTVEVAKGADGKDTYTMKSGGKTYTLEAGPPWFFGDKYPLKPFVGKSVTVVGEIAEGSTDVDVESVNGKALRASGKPPWAGGWKVVGPNHPGWSQEKADRFKAKFGDCFPPGQCKDKPNKGADADKDETDGSDAPKASKAPAATHGPTATQAPAVTQAPAATEAPVDSTAPTASEPPAS